MERPNNMTPILLLFVTAFLWGLSPILEKIGLGKTDPLAAVTIRSFAVTGALLVYLFATGKIRMVFAQDPKSIAIFTASGLLAGLVGMWTYFGALKTGATSRVVPIAATYPLITAILSILLLKEGVSPARLAGTILIIAGIWLVK